MRKSALIALCSVLVGLVAGCGGTQNAAPATNTPGAPTVASLSIAGGPTGALAPGATATEALTVTAHLSDGTSTDVTGDINLAWTCAPAGGATVDSNGHLQAGATAGADTLTAAYGGKTATFPFTIGGSSTPAPLGSWVVDVTGWKMNALPSGAMTVDANGKPWLLETATGGAAVQYRASRLDSATTQTNIPLPATTTVNISGSTLTPAIFYWAIKAYGPAVYVLGYRMIAGAHMQSFLTQIDINHPLAATHEVILDSGVVTTDLQLANAELDPAHNRIYTAYKVGATYSLYQFGYTFPGTFPATDSTTAPMAKVADLPATTVSGFFGTAVRSDGKVVVLSYGNTTVSLSLVDANGYTSWTVPEASGTLAKSLYWTLAYNPNNGNTYCLDFPNSRVVAYDANGSNLLAFTENADTVYSTVTGALAVDATHNVLYIAGDEGNSTTGVNIRSYSIPTLTFKGRSTPAAATRRK